tara:strand:- start:463 stop:777 length:315 start_codon:yes stop_codon:yes gene_type:complete
VVARFGELGKSVRSESEQLVELMIVVLVGLEQQGDGVELTPGLGQHIKPVVVFHGTNIGLETIPGSGLVWPAMVSAPGQNLKSLIADGPARLLWGIYAGAISQS